VGGVGDIEGHDAADALEADERVGRAVDGRDATASGSGPLSSLRASSESFASLSELKPSGKRSARTRSIVSPESQTSEPLASQIETERAPKQ
jgi:hypothetical protein